MGPNNTSCGCKNGHSSQVLPRADIKQRHLQQYLNRTRFSHTPGFPCAGRTVGSAGSGILTLVHHVFGTEVKIVPLTRNALPAFTRQHFSKSSRLASSTLALIPSAAPVIAALL